MVSQAMTMFYVMPILSNWNPSLSFVFFILSKTFEDLSASLQESNITVISSETFDKNPATQVANLKVTLCTKKITF